MCTIHPSHTAAVSILLSFNDGNLITDAFVYEEDMEYNTNMLVLSFAYMYGYDVVGRRKGRSTSKVGKKKRK